MAILAELAKLDLPVVANAGKVDMVSSLGIKKTIVLQERMVTQGSKDFIAMSDADDIMGLSNSPLNERTLENLQNIKQILLKRQVGIGDTQFLVTKKGRVVVSDPQRPAREMLNESIERIDDFMKAVEKAIRSRM